MTAQDDKEFRDWVDGLPPTAAVIAALNEHVRLFSAPVFVDILENQQRAPAGVHSLVSERPWDFV